MEFMYFVKSNAFQQWVVQFLVVLFLVGGFVLLVTGLGLIFNSAGTLRFFSGMNRWVSSRRAFKPLEVPRDTRQAVQKYRRWLAVIFVGGGIFAIFGLSMRFDVRAVSFLFGLDHFRPSFASWVVESARWVLIVGNLAGIVVGIMLAFLPDALMALEARGAHWYSERAFVKNRDAMNLTLDGWVAQFPRASGCIITFFALVLIGAFGLMLPAAR
jgi:hypothetical protein